MICTRLWRKKWFCRQYVKNTQYTHVEALLLIYRYSHLFSVYSFRILFSRVSRIVSLILRTVFTTKLTTISRTDALLQTSRLSTKLIIETVTDEVYFTSATKQEWILEHFRSTLYSHNALHDSDHLPTEGQRNTENNTPNNNHWNHHYHFSRVSRKHVTCSVTRVDRYSDQ